LKGSERWQ
jgi:aconitate hydratase